MKDALLFSMIAACWFYGKDAVIFAQGTREYAALFISRQGATTQRFFFAELPVGKRVAQIFTEGCMK
jgi:hypothetical protein